MLVLLILFPIARLLIIVVVRFMAEVRFPIAPLKIIQLSAAEVRFLLVLLLILLLLFLFPIAPLKIIRQQAAAVVRFILLLLILILYLYPFPIAPLKIIRQQAAAVVRFMLVPILLLRLPIAPCITIAPQQTGGGTHTVRRLPNHTQLYFLGQCGGRHGRRPNF